MSWGESDDEKFGPDGRYGRWLHERHASGKFAEIRRTARVLMAADESLSLQEAERRAEKALNESDE
jgi:hypothetical protein